MSIPTSQTFTVTCDECKAETLIDIAYDGIDGSEYGVFWIDGIVSEVQNRDWVVRGFNEVICPFCQTHPAWRPLYARSLRRARKKG